MVFRLNGTNNFLKSSSVFSSATFALKSAIVRKGLAASNLVTSSDESPSAIKSDSVARLAFKTAIGVLFSTSLFSKVVSGFCFFSADSLQDTSNKLIDSMIIDSLLNFFIVLFY